MQRLQAKDRMPSDGVSGHVSLTSLCRTTLSRVLRRLPRLNLRPSKGNSQELSSPDCCDVANHVAVMPSGLDLARRRQRGTVDIGVVRSPIPRRRGDDGRRSAIADHHPKECAMSYVQTASRRP